MKLFFILFLLNAQFLYSQVNITKVDKLPKAAEYEGDPKLIYKVEDKEGTHFLFVTRREVDEFGTKGYVSEIRAYKFSSSPKGFQKTWEIKDFNTHPLMNIEWVDNVFEVGDWDGDGVVESALIYKLSQDGLDPNIYKLICHYKNKKFVIRYEMNKQEGPGKNPKADKSISKLPERIQKKLKDLWMKHVGMEY